MISGKRVLISGKRSRVAGGSASLQFVGTQIRWRTHRGPTYGKTSVYLDGALVQTECNYNATDEDITYTYSLAVYGVHTIELIAAMNAVCNNHTGKTALIRFEAFAPGATLTPVPSPLPYLNLSNNLSDSLQPSVATSPDGTRVAVAWQEQAQGNYDIWLTTSADSGVTWTRPFNLSRTPGRSSRPSVAVDSLGVAHVVWRDTTSATDRILYCRYEGGSQCAKFYIVSNTSGDADSPQIVARETTTTTLHLVYTNGVG